MDKNSTINESSGFHKEIGLFGGISLVAGMTIGNIKESPIFLNKFNKWGIL